MPDPNPQWWRFSITFMGPATDRADAMARLRAFTDGLPMRDLKLSADPMAAKEVLRGLDREEAKRQIEADEDAGVRLTELRPISDADIFNEEQGLLGGMVPMPGAPRHPWLDGVSIFPPDHPLAAYERLARDQHDQPALEKLKELSPGDS
jgi:hypothetical protein